MLLSTFGILALAIVLHLLKWAREGVKLCKMEIVVVFSGSSVLPEANLPSLEVFICLYLPYLDSLSRKLSCFGLADFVQVCLCLFSCVLGFLQVVTSSQLNL